MMRNFLVYLRTIAIAVAVSTSLHGADIDGRVFHVEDQVVKITLDSDGAAEVGDTVEIFVIVEGMGDEALVAKARVTDVDAGSIAARIEELSSAVEPGQRVRIIAAGPAKTTTAKTPDKTWIGVRAGVVTDQAAARAEMDVRSGVLVEAVFPGHSADEQGLQAGDIVVRADGEPVRPRLCWKNWGPNRNRARQTHAFHRKPAGAASSKE